MSSVNWNTVEQQAVSAAAKSLGSSWDAVQGNASHSISMLVQTAQYIEANSAKLSQPEKNLLANNQKLALQNVLMGCEAIGIAAAEMAVAAAWGVIQSALGTAISAAA